MLYILSPSYSGSTLLTFLLASHPDIATVGELKASAMGDLETYRCSCGSLLKECCFWKQVQHEMQRRGADLSLDDFGTHFNNGTAIFRRLTRLGVKHPLFATLSSLALETLPPLRVQLTKIVEQNRLLIEVISGIQRGRVFLDGSKDPERLNQFLNSSHWNVKVVRLIRDGRGVTNSYRKHYQVSMEEAAREWVATERACDRVAARLTPTDVLTVKYEDFCEKPQEILLRIVRFVGLDPAPQANRRVPAEFHILGNQMRLAPGKAITLDEKWRKELQPSELSVFARLAGDCNRTYGYNSPH